ncbi:polyadenylate-binding protein RBP47B' [Ricinus communis]|uniref:polyadenylate-binding protein RBP47B' n=1 Tax=Ricinus communis TaxID=3988 RepID=UPI0007724996|nr:polyadenylate-binding protein RBP47B' [Ricinus communis]|eukprot:XP_015571309.1 polyadenylate-binding protein RBP47B' [Ricinus communis]
MAAPTATNPGGYHQPATLEEVRTLWIGDLQYWVDENYLSSCFAHTGEVLSIKIIRNKITGQPEGYGFVEFVSHVAAERILQTYNGTQMPGTEQTFRLNWASFGIGERRPDAGPEHSIFVGDLSPDVTDYLLQETFRANYPSVRGAKVVTDPNTGRSKGYGFVKFGDENERNRAMTEMNGVFCSTRPMRISAATPKKTAAYQQQYATAKAIYPLPAYTAPVQVVPADNDITNTTIFVGNLDPNVTEEELRPIFLQFGEIVYVKIPVGRGCGFVQFATRASAEEAIQRMQGHVIGQQPVRISWGRKQDATGGWGQQVDQWSAYYGYGQGYDAYAYGATQDPSLYAYGAYAGYPQYPQQVDGVQDMTGAIPVVEQREELYDPLAAPDVDKLNGAYLSVHGNAILGRPLWMKTSLSQQA